jgi:hypothetical protein
LLRFLDNQIFFFFNKGHTIVSFQLFEFPTQLPTNEQIINVLKNLIDKQILNLIDLNRRLLHVICGSLIVGMDFKISLIYLLSIVIFNRSER